MINGVKVGKTYNFQLHSGLVYTGKVDVIEDDIIVIWNPVIGEREFTIHDCKSICTIN